MKKNIISLLLVLCFINIFPKSVSAEWVYENGKMVLTQDSYDENGKIKVYCTYYRLFPDTRKVVELPNVEKVLPKLEFIGADAKFVNGSLSYVNLDKITPGYFDLQYIFTPNDDKYATITGYFRLEVYPEDSEESKGKIETETTDTTNTNASLLLNESSPSLTKSKLTLKVCGKYDINIKNKISNSTYSWTSSDKKVATVNKKNGLVTAVKKGKAVIKCVITTPTGEKITLKCNVTVK